ncbi:MAG TPA: DUF4383 domain-containing protein [Magnetospirillaceae bacterium]|nr:DUF4383 domain-containing protein [Magnetospirillaceae bacterium]
MLKKVAMVFGAVFLLVGLLGFVPGITSTNGDGMQLLLGLFMVDPIHSAVHIVSGLAGLVAAGASTKAAKAYLIGFGVIYALVSLVGFFDLTLFGLMHVNMADNWLHIVLTLGLLGAGLGLSDDSAAMPTSAKKVM